MSGIDGKDIIKTLRRLEARTLINWRPKRGSKVLLKLL
jgi:hypothetical protein